MSHEKSSNMDDFMLIYDINSNNTDKGRLSAQSASMHDFSSVHETTTLISTLTSMSHDAPLPEKLQDSARRLIPDCYRPTGRSISAEANLEVFREPSDEISTLTGDFEDPSPYTFGGMRHNDDVEEDGESFCMDTSRIEKLLRELGVDSSWDHDQRNMSVAVVETPRSQKLNETPLDWEQIEESWPHRFLTIKARECSSREKIVGFPLKTSTPKPESHFRQYISSPSMKLAGLSKLEELIYEATSDELCETPDGIMTQIWSLVFKSNGIQHALEVLWHRMLSNNEGKWLRVVKSIELLMCLMQEEDEIIMTDIEQHELQLRSLVTDFFCEEMFQEDPPEDCGVFVRQAARKVLAHLFKYVDELAKKQKDTCTPPSELATEVSQDSSEIRAGQSATSFFPVVSGLNSISSISAVRNDLRNVHGGKPMESSKDSYSGLACFEMQRPQQKKVGSDCVIGMQKGHCTGLPDGEESSSSFRRAATAASFSPTPSNISPAAQMMSKDPFGDIDVFAWFNSLATRTKDTSAKKITAGLGMVKGSEPAENAKEFTSDVNLLMETNEKQIEAVGTAAKEDIQKPGWKGAGKDVSRKELDGPKDN